MEIIKTTFEDVTELVSGILSSQSEVCVYCVSDKNVAIVGKNATANVDEISKRGLQLIRINNEGGTIITSAGDVQIGIFTEGYSGDEYRSRIIDALINKLKANGQDAVIVNNDVLVNDRKVIGMGSRMFGKILYTAIQCSVNIDLELIKAVCTKPMNKIPDGLSNYGVTTEDVIEILFSAVND